MSSTSREELVKLHLSLLELEREEEEARQDRKFDLGDKLLLELIVEDAGEKQGAFFVTVRHQSSRRLPRHSIEQGSRVTVFEGRHPHFKAYSKEITADFAVVTKVTPKYLALTFSYEPDFRPEDTVSVLQSNNSNYRQLSDAMLWLQSVDTSDKDKPAASVVRMMFKEHQAGNVVQGPSVVTTNGLPLCWINKRLDTSQRQAVVLALRKQPLTVIHGPPGTGKTTTIVEVILQHVARGQRVMVCAPSNKAVDNLLEGLYKQTMEAVGGMSMSMANVVRLGHLARMDEKLRQFSLTVRLRRRMKRKGRRKRMSAEDRKQEKIERLEKQAKILEEAFVLMSTLTSVGSVPLPQTYDLLVIDECAQATEAACWLAIPLARKVLLAGDPYQLPPTILSQEAARRGLAVSLMERQMKLHGKDVVHMLDTQYRMHELIQAWSSRHLYDGQLKAAPEVSSRLLIELPGVHSTRRTQPTLLLVDTAGCNLRETQDGKTSSCSNQGEADFVVRHTASLVKAGMQAEDIGVITPYKRQVRIIAGKMRADGLNVEVNSVDGYQGREKEAILLSLVRSNERGKVGFVGDCRRLNVAVTRARRHLFVICDTTTVCRNKTIRSLVNHLEHGGEAQSAFCDRCPGSKQERKPGGALSPFVSAASSTTRPKMPVKKPLTSLVPFQELGVPSVSRLTNSMGAMTLKTQEIGAVRDSTRVVGVRDSDGLGSSSSKSTYSMGAMTLKRQEIGAVRDSARVVGVRDSDGLGSSSKSTYSMGAMTLKRQEIGAVRDSIRVVGVRDSDGLGSSSKSTYSMGAMTLKRQEIGAVRNSARVVGVRDSDGLGRSSYVPEVPAARRSAAGVPYTRALDVRVPNNHDSDFGFRNQSHDLRIPTRKVREPIGTPVSGPFERCQIL